MALAHGLRACEEVRVQSELVLELGKPPAAVARACGVGRLLLQAHDLQTTAQASGGVRELHGMDRAHLRFRRQPALTRMSS